MNKSIRNVFMNLALLFGSMFFLIMVGEIILRLIGFSNPNFYTYNDIVGHRLYPGAEGWFRKEGEAYIRINSDGLRDREHTLKKPPNTIRIAVLGDSYTAAFQVPIEYTFWSVMERNLNACKPFGEKRVEVINFGISGDGTAQEFLTLQYYGWKYSPDIVLLAFLTGNDIRNNSKILEPKKLRPFFVFQDETLVLDSSFVNTPAYKRKTGRLRSAYRLLSRYLRLLQVLNMMKTRYVSSQQHRKSRVEGDEIGLDSSIYVEPTSPEWQEAWKITEDILIKMQTEANAHNARLVIVSLSNGIQVHPDTEVRKGFMKELNVDDLFYPEKRFEQFGKQEGIEVLTLAPILQEYAETHNVFLHGFENTTPGFGHWNMEGHRLAGEFMAEYFCSGTHDGL